MTFYLSIMILTELLMIAMSVHVLTYSGFTRTQKVWYMLTFIAIMICNAAEFAVHCGYYNPIFKIPLTIITVIQFSVAPLLAFLFAGALGIRNQGKIAVGFLVTNFIVEIVCAPFGWIFYFNNEGYFRGNFFVIYIIFYAISLAYLVVSMFIVGRNFRHRDVVTIVTIFIILVAGIIPMTIFKINVAYCAIGIAASLCYIYYNDLVQEDIKNELVINQEKMSYMQTNMISGLANLIENRDLDTGEHITRTSKYVKLLAEHARRDGYYENEINDHFIALLYTLAPMHDIGKVVVPDYILKKPGPLTAEEYEIMKQHAAVGGKVVREVLNGVTDEEYLSFASDIATYHHERWDGSGYPIGLKGKEIPLSARIMAIADAYDALISKRCYKEALSIEVALVIIEEEAGTHFDPNLVKVFIDHEDDFK